MQEFRENVKQAEQPRLCVVDSQHIHHRSKDLLSLLIALCTQGHDEVPRKGRPYVAVHDVARQLEGAHEAFRVMDSHGRIQPRQLILDKMLMPKVLKERD